MFVFFWQFTGGQVSGCACGQAALLGVAEAAQRHIPCVTGA